MKYSLIFLIGFAFVACENNESGIRDYASSSVDDEMKIAVPRTSEPAMLEEHDLYIDGAAITLNTNSAQTQNTTTNSPVSEALIIRTGKMTVEVEDLDYAKNELDALITKSKGYYQNEEYFTRSDQTWYTMTIRIPSHSFQSLVENISLSGGKVTQKNIEARDMTEEFVDLEMRLANNEVYIQRYVDLVKRAEEIEDILTIQEKIRRIEEEIEAKKGRMKYLSNQASYSTLFLTMKVHHPVIAVADDDHFIDQVSTAFISGYNAMLGVVIGIVAFWPMLTFFGIIIYGFRKFGILRKKPAAIPNSANL